MVRVKPQRESWRREASFGGGAAASPGEGTRSHVRPHPHFWQEDLWNQNRSSERKGVRVKGRTAVCVLEEAADGKDGLTWGAGRAAVPCSLG